MVQQMQMDATSKNRMLQSSGGTGAYGYGSRNTRYLDENGNYSCWLELVVRLGGGMRTV